jgi:hypothetical protein
MLQKQLSPGLLLIGKEFVFYALWIPYLVLAILKIHLTRIYVLTILQDAFISTWVKYYLCLLQL